MEGGTKGKADQCVEVEQLSGGCWWGWWWREGQQGSDDQCMEVQLSLDRLCVCMGGGVNRRVLTSVRG